MSTVHCVQSIHLFRMHFYSFSHLLGFGSFHLLLLTATESSYSPAELPPPAPLRRSRERLDQRHEERQRQQKELEQQPQIQVLQQTPPQPQPRRQEGRRQQRQRQDSSPSPAPSPSLSPASPTGRTGTTPKSAPQTPRMFFKSYSPCGFFLHFFLLTFLIYQKNRLGTDFAPFNFGMNIGA